MDLDNRVCNEENNDIEPLKYIISTIQSIDSIHRTEACVFYVLSQLSHGDKPSAYLFNNFDSISVCLLNYLKNARVRNPRALRILNRLTKNHYCFYSFILTQFPYRLKSIFVEEPQKNLKKLGAKKCNKLVGGNSLLSKKHCSQSCNDLDRLKNKSYNTSMGGMNQKEEEDILKEMNVYLNSNKVFFDAQTFFPSFESIEFTLINNLKMQCISSSDHGYLSLISMMKYSQKRIERLSCSLVAPFILRNSKALQYIMVIYFTFIFYLP